MITRSITKQATTSYLADDGTLHSSFDEANQHLIEQENKDMAKEDKTAHGDDKLNVQQDNSNADDGKTEAERHADAMANVAHVNAPGEFHDTPELPASEMSIEDAEKINSNVNAPGEYPPNPTGGEPERLGQHTGQTQTDAPHQTGKNQANSN